MTVLRRTLFAVPAFTLLASFASPAAALPPAERTLFAWSGVIDREVVIMVRGRRVETRASGLDASFAPRLEVRDDLPRQAGVLGVRLVGGRGTVEILQQPSPGNDYTALVRVRDPRAGRDNYQLVAAWESFDDRRGGRDDDDRGRGRDDDDRGRGRDDDNRGRGRDDDDRGRGGWDDDDRDRDRDRDRARDRDRDRRDDGRLTWRGEVDDVAEIRIQGRRVEFRTRSGAPLQNVRYDLRGNGLPRRNVTMALDIDRSRGEVVVVQQPSRLNGYTAIVRVIDRRGGYGSYGFNLAWF